MKIPVIVIHLFLAAANALDENSTNIHAELYSRLFSDNYKKELIPKCKINDVIKLTIDLLLRQIIDIDEPKQSIKLLIWVRLHWNDCLLTWNASNYGNFSFIIVPQSKVWTPDVASYESNTQVMPKLERGNVKIHSNGSLYFSYAIVLESVCALDITFFPFDTQQCVLTFVTWSYSMNDVDFFPKHDMVNLVEFVKNGEWNLLELPAIRKEKIYQCCKKPFAEVIYHLVLERKPLFYIINLLLPCTLISSIALFGFLLPPNSGEKISIQVTTLLSLAVFFLVVREIIPPNSETAPILGVYASACMGLVAISCVMSVTVINVYYRGSREDFVPTWIRKAFLGRLPYLLCLKKAAAPPLVKVLKYKAKDITHSFENEVVDPKSGAANKRTLKNSSGVDVADNNPAEFMSGIHNLGEEAMSKDKHSEWTELAIVLDRTFAIFFLLCYSTTVFIFIFQVAKRSTLF